MTRYLISFRSDAMDHIPEEEIPDVARDAHAVVQEAQDAGVFVFAGGLDEDVGPVLVAGDGTVTAGTYPLGGITIIDVPSREAALQWAAKIAAACRCAQDVTRSWPTRRWATDRSRGHSTRRPSRAERYCFAHQSRRSSTSSRVASPRLGAPTTRISRPSGPAS